MSGNPVVSVVIPTYDRPEMLKRAIQSVRNQTYPSIELVVVDGPSSVPASEVVADFDEMFTSIQCVRNETKEGVTTARNTGLELATGEYIAFLDDDDQWAAGKIEAQVERFEREGEEVGLVYTGVRQLDANGQTTATKSHKVEGDIFAKLLSGNFIGTMSAIMVRGDVIDAIGRFDEELPVWEDWDLYLRIAEKFEVSSVSELHVDRQSGEQEQTSDEYEIRRDIAAPKLLQKHRSRARTLGRIAERKFAAAVELELTKSAAGNDFFREARKHAVQSLKWYPLRKTLLYVLLLSGGSHTYRPVQRIKRTIVQLFVK